MRGKQHSTRLSAPLVAAFALCVGAGCTAPEAGDTSDPPRDAAAIMDARGAQDAGGGDAGASADTGGHVYDTGTSSSDAAASSDTSDASTSVDIPDIGCPDGGCPDGCTPRTCAHAGARCGMISNGCGQMIDCGRCASGTCEQNQCVPSHCTDGKQNRKESDTDCGGPNCAPCKPERACNSFSDCTTKVCKEGFCAAASCQDTVQNGTETDSDCGGSECAGCSAGGACRRDSDCFSKRCVGGACKMATCSDGIRNGKETGVDCGGSCNPCRSYAWKTGTWSKCGPSTCRQTRTVECKRKDGKTVADSKCSGTKPDATRKCSLTTSPSVSGSWTQRQHMTGQNDRIRTISGKQNKLEIADCRSGNISSLTFQNVGLSGAWSQQCYAQPRYDRIQSIKGSGNAIVIKTSRGSSKVRLSGATVSGSWHAKCNLGSCDLIQKIAGSGTKITITSSQSKTGTLTLSGVQICP